MKPVFKILLSFLLLSYFSFYAAGSYAEEEAESSNLFKYQELKANKGDEKAQYKLATMYENGTGIKKDETLAKHWYHQAANQGSADARMREIYLEVKASGFTSAHGDWLKSVKTAASKGDAQAKFLLAQLYRQGIGVKRDPARAKQLYDQITVFDVPYVYQELALLNVNGTATAKKSAIATTTTRQPPATMVKKPVKTRTKKTPKAVISTADQQALAAKKMAEKRRHYEQVMLKLKREQQQIDELQASMSTDPTIGVDEEF